MSAVLQRDECIQQAEWGNFTFKKVVWYNRQIQISVHFPVDGNK